MTKGHGKYSLQSEIAVTPCRLTRYVLRGFGKKKVLLNLLFLFITKEGLFSCVSREFGCLFLVVFK